MGDERRSRWNHNIQYHGVILAEVPAGARSALDAGTGDGMLAAELRASIPDVVAIDLDESVLARAAVEHPGIHWVHGDVMTHAFGRRFDVVASVAVVHHLPDLAAALRRLASLTAPGACWSSSASPGLPRCATTSSRSSASCSIADSPGPGGSGPAVA